MKKIAILPTLLTLGNAVCGFAAIAAASKIDFRDPLTGELIHQEVFFAWSGWLILLAMVFDAMDGYVARLSRSTSKFGGELDSLCDAISFGAAPAFLLMRMGPGWQPRPVLHQCLAAIAVLYLLCALLRLARFNVEHAPDPNTHKRFRGLPSPGAAGCIASLAIFRGESAVRWFPVDADVFQVYLELFATVGALCVALLMVSRVPYPHITKQILHALVGRKNFGRLIEVVVLLFVVLLFRQLGMVLIFWVYALFFALRYLLVRSLRREALPTPAGFDDFLPR